MTDDGGCRPRVGRYAPSPTGRLHIGNVATAVFSWLQMRLVGGRFILRIEDLDAQRSRAMFERAIVEDLTWLGIDWDEGPGLPAAQGSWRQSERSTDYQHALERIARARRLYACGCSRRDIHAAIGAPHGGELVYPGRCRPDERRADVDLQASMAIRLALEDECITFRDACCGAQRQRLADQVGDFVVRRADGVFTYQLAVVVDDMAMGVTDVLRGADLLGSTARQILLWQLLGEAPPPNWCHTPLLVDDQGRRLAKRDDSASVDYWREQDGGAARLLGRIAAAAGLIDTPYDISADELLQEVGTAARLTKALASCNQRIVWSSV
ncbi:tRNA glutamyl-Q(34) synthetase GluQRS [Gammaproteobacteria bacterium]|nr:tRNA glutamyl-Q(34) synthetase GluQRS [Gammaproteobacteria bacterium]